MAVAFQVSEVVEAAERLREAADKTDMALGDTFRTWAKSAEKFMRDEVPKDTWETHDSITVEYDEGLTATIGPTNRDEKGRPVAFFINYGTKAQPPNDFIGRTTRRARKALQDFDVADVL